MPGVECRRYTNPKPAAFTRVRLSIRHGIPKLFGRVIRAVLRMFLGIRIFVFGFLSLVALAFRCFFS